MKQEENFKNIICNFYNTNRAAKMGGGGGNFQQSKNNRKS